MVVVFYVPTYLQYYSTVQYSTVQFCCTYMCSKQEHKADHGHKKGHSPRAQEGHSSTGISRPRTEVLRTRAYFSAANTLLRSRASRGHLNLFVLNGISFVRGSCSPFCFCTSRKVLSSDDVVHIFQNKREGYFSKGNNVSHS